MSVLSWSYKWHWGHVVAVLPPTPQPPKPTELHPFCSFARVIRRVSYGPDLGQMKD